MAESTESSKAVQSTSLFSSSSTIEKDKEKASCLSCVRLLQEILLSETSRPHRLLQSIAAGPAYMTASNASALNKPSLGASAAPAIVVERTATAETPHAVTVQLSENAAIPLQRQVSRLHPPEMSSAAVNLATPSISFFSSARRRSSLNNKNLTSPQLATSSVAPPSPTSATATVATADPSSQKITISCRSCAMTGPEGNARAFVMGPNPLSIVLCTNRLPHLATASSSNSNTSNAAARQELEEVLTHELMHVYDVKQLQLDLRVCQNLAYSEVRAAREAECYSQTQHHQHDSRTTDWWRNNHQHLTTTQRQQEACVRSKALAATRNLFEYTAAQECVQAVFEKAMQDKRPFGAYSKPYYRQSSSLPSER